MSISKFNNANDIDSVLQAAAYLKAKKEVTKGTGHFGILGSAQKNATLERTAEILRNIDHNPVAQSMLLDKHLPRRNITSSTAKKFLQGYDNICKIKTFLAQNPSICSVKSNIDKFTTQSQQTISFQKAENEKVMKEITSNPGFELIFKKFPETKEGFTNLYQQNMQILDNLTTQLENISNKIINGENQENIFKDINQQIVSARQNLGTLRTTLPKLRRMAELQKKPAQAYQNALKRLNLNVEENRHPVTPRDYYTANEAAQNIIEAAAIIANKPRSDRTSKEQTILNDLQRYSNPSLKDGYCMDIPEGYEYLYRGAISEAFKTKLGRGLESKLGTRFNHEPTHPIRGIQADALGITRLPWPTPDNPSGASQLLKPRSRTEIHDNYDY